VKKHRSTLWGLIVLVGLWAGWTTSMEAHPEAGPQTRAKTDAKTGPQILADRGLNFSHEEHFKKQKMECMDCHGMEPAQRSMPNHQLCSLCHETDEDAEDALECSYCHTRTDNTVDKLPKFFADEVKFAHEAHREQKCSDCHPRGEILKTRMPDDPSKSDTPQMPTCKLCHPDPDAGRFAAKPAMPLCVKCHQSMDESRSQCAICHKTITGKTLPTHHAGVRVFHDDPKRWKTEYAKLHRKDPVFCSYCHDEPFDP